MEIKQYQLAIFTTTAKFKASSNQAAWTGLITFEDFDWIGQQ